MNERAIEIRERIRDDRVHYRDSVLTLRESHIVMNALQALEAYEKENAELRARLEKAVELPCKLGDTTVYAIECYSCGYYMREYCAAEIAVTEDGEFAFYSPEIPARRLIFGKDIFTSKEAAEARLKKIKENNDDVRRI